MEIPKSWLTIIFHALPFVSLSLVIISKTYKCTALATLLTEDFIRPSSMVIEGMPFQGVVKPGPATFLRILWGTLMLGRVSLPRVGVFCIASAMGRFINIAGLWPYRQHFCIAKRSYNYWLWGIDKETTRSSLLSGWGRINKNPIFQHLFVFILI